jgi:predicted transcriptional regulator
MTMTETEVVGVVGEAPSKIEWGPVIAGALAGAALAFVLHGFAVAIGISVSSTAPTWRDASFALVFLSGLYLLLTAIVSYGFGAYVAARLRRRFEMVQADESFSDGMHGLLVWALATLLTAIMAVAVAGLGTRLAAPSGAGGPSSSVAGENIIALDLDRLLRGDRRQQGDPALTRAEAARILLTAPSHRGVAPEDRAWLVRLVSASTGIAPPEAERRVDSVIGRAKENIDRARRSAAILAFMAAAAALVGAAVAWWAAFAGGRHRDSEEAIPSFWNWGNPYETTQPTRVP